MKRLSCLLPLLLTGCSYAYEVSYSVTLSAPVSAPVVLVLSEHHLSSGTQTDELQIHALSPESNTVKGKMGICCAPDPTVSLWAFVDSNSNNTWDPSEARSVDPRGVFVLKDNTSTTLSITPKPEPLQEPAPVETAPEETAPEQTAPGAAAP